MRLRYAGAALLSGLAAFAGAAHAQHVLRSFHLGAGPAAVSLPEFARQGGLRLLANGDDLAGITTRAVQGRYAPEQALGSMLAGTSLQARINPNGTILVVKDKSLVPEPKPVAAVPQRQSGETAKVSVVGVRASQQNSIERKKNAVTAFDAIIAEDVGAFPDRNAAEAISRIAGVTLERGDYGEGTTLNVRGNPAQFTRVEIDGLGVQAAGGTDLNNGGSGRGVELRELSTDLIKSIDVVKGATADMSEGSLGGSIIIRTRTGLDFDKRYLAVRVAAQQNSINEQWTPNLNLVFADKFLEKRLGVMFNLTKSAARNENHTMSVSNRDIGMSRALDLDGSVDKTFSYQPSTVSATDPAATAPLARWGRVGGGSVDALSPLEIVSRSAAATSKEACQTSFPLYSSAELASIGTSADRTAAQNQRAGELQSCLNQWNDYLPQNLRYQMRREYDRRVYGDLRLDFRVSDNLSVYAKLNRNTRKIDDDQLFLSQGAIVVGPVANIVPALVKVDANHHATEFALANASINNDQIYEQIGSESRYAQIGATWRSSAFRAEFLAGRVRADAWRMQWRTNFNFPYGATTVSVSPEGWWAYSPAPGTGYDQKDISNYGRLQAPSEPGQPLASSPTQLTLANPRVMERSEDTARLDMSYTLPARIPYFSRITFGGSRRSYGLSSWSGGGYTAQSGSGLSTVVVPRVAQSSRFLACENTPGSLGVGGTPCAYGTTTSRNPATAFNSTIVMTQLQYRDIVAQALGRDTITFFNSLPNRPEQLVQGWTEIDVRKVIEVTGVRNFNLDCMKVCTGSDGQRYEQPRAGVKERITAAYVSTEFDIDRIPFTSGPLPFGWELSGNVGWRLVRTGVAATGLMTFQSIATTDAYDPRNPDASGGTASVALARNTTLRESTLDVMPILNLAWSPVKDVMVRYNKAKSVARPPVEYLYSNGVSCTFDARKLAGAGDDDESMSCDGTIGNPGLRAQVNRNYNLSVEWYPNRDTMLSLSRFRQRGVIGAAQRIAVIGAKPFAGTGTIDPLSGRDLSDVRFSFATYMNGPAIERNGFEVSTKTAFTFLPSFLRATGLDMNYTRVRSKNLGAPVRDLLTGDPMAPANEMKYTWNASLWYDDGKLRARVAMQSAAGFFRGLAVLANNYPANGVTGGSALPYNPGAATFRDGSRFIDAKISYRFDNGIELFAEGRNLGRAAVTNSQGAYAPFAGGTPNLLDYAYYGAQYMVGMTIRH